MRKTIVSGGLAAMLLLSGINVVGASDDISNKEIENAKEELKNINTEKSNKSDEKKKLDMDLMKLKEEKDRLENKLIYLDKHLDKKEDELIELNEELSDLKNGIVKTESLLSEREDEFKTRINILYKEHMTSDTKLMEVIINSEGFYDLIKKLINYKKIVGKDNDVLVNYFDLINKLEKDSKAVENVINDINDKIKEIEDIVEKLEDTLKDKVEVEYSLNNKILDTENHLKKLDKDVSNKEEEINRLILEEKERIELSKLEAQMKEEINKFKNDSGKKQSYNDLKDLNFNGDEDFKKHQKSVNWMRKQVGKENLDNYYKIIDKYSKTSGIPSAVIKGIIMTESTFNNKTTNVNRNGTVDRGLMQMNSGTAPSVAKELGLSYEVGMEFIPDINIKMGTYYISKYYDGNDIHKGLTSYNRGPTGAKNWRAKHGTYASDYSNRVVSYMRVFLEEEKNLNK